MDKVTNELINAITRFYQPAATAAEATEFKTTIDLQNEFTDFADISKTDIFEAMTGAGFRIEYIGTGFAWLMK